MRADTVLVQVAILFALLLAGFIACRSRAVPASASKGLTSVIIKVTMPAMIIDSMASQPFSLDALAQSGIVLGWSFAVYALLIALALPLGALLAGKRREDRGVYRFILTFSNVGFMGFPVVTAIFGTQAVFWTAIYNLPFNLLVFTLGVLMLIRSKPAADGSGAPAPGPTARELVREVLLSPVVVSIVIGFVLFVAQLRLPDPVKESLRLAGSVTSPLSMIAIGIMLAQSSLRSTLRQWRLYVASSLRLLVWPLLVWVILRPLNADPLLAAVPAIITAMPAAANTALLAQEHGANERLAAESVFISTLLSVATIPFVAWLISLGY